MQTDYVIKLKKKCKKCWLLLLIWLLLFIPIKKTIKIKVIDFSNNFVTNEDVFLQYNKRIFFSLTDLKFFKQKLVPEPYLSEKTNNEGIATFNKVFLPLYQLLFFNKDLTFANVKNDCFAGDSSYLYLKSFKTEVFDLKTDPVLTDLKLIVVDVDDNNEPLPSTKVILKSNKTNYLDSTISDTNGFVTFTNVPICSSIEFKSSKYGWFFDTISKDANEVQKPIDTIFMRQKMQIIKFYVKDLSTGVPIVGAIGYLSFEQNPQLIIDSAIANVNGVGKGVFDDEIHILKKIKIDVKYKCFQDNSYGNYITVDRWNNYTDEQKTIYLKKKKYRVKILLQKCWNAGRDHYNFYVDNKFVTYYKATTGSDTLGGIEGTEHYHKDAYYVELECGSHNLKMKVVKQPGNGTCGGCSRIIIPEFGYNFNFGRQHNSPDTVFLWNITINK